MTRRLLTTCCVIFLVLACGGSDGSRTVFSDPIIGSGDIITDVRSLPPFDSVDLMAHADVYLVEGGAQNVRIEADDNIIGHIMTTVSAGGVLIIDADATYDSAHGVEIYLNATDVRSLQLTGVGIIDATNIDSMGNVRATLTGVGTISLSGVADTFDGMHSGVGVGGVAAIDAEDLSTRRSTIVLSGVGDCRVTFTDELNVTISGIGDVYFAGNPANVNATITGTGKVIQL
jgi:hypothetical protein